MVSKINATKKSSKKSLKINKKSDNINVYQDGLSNLLREVITSWQVIAVTIALVLYMFLVFYVAKAYRQPRMKSIKISLKRTKSEPKAGPEEVEGGDDSNDELGLEEA
jgi:hypothetical protein